MLVPLPGVGIQAVRVLHQSLQISFVGPGFQDSLSDSWIEPLASGPRLKTLAGSEKGYFKRVHCSAPLGRGMDEATRHAAVGCSIGKSVFS